MLKKAGFKSSNISAMFNSSGANIEEAIEILTKNQKALIKFATVAKFTPANISNMLNGSGINIDKGIKTLSDNQEELLKFMQATGFNSGNISAMLGGGGGIKYGKRYERII